MVEQSLKLQNTYLKIIYYALATLLICVLQLSFSYLISIYGVTPDLLILLVIWVTLFEGKLYGLIFAFAVGILYDFLSMNVVGVNALTKTMVAYLASFFYQEKEFWNIIRSNKFFLICFLATLLHNIVYYFIMVELTDSIFAIYFKFVIGSTIYTMLFALLAFFFRIRKFW